jgi:acyl-CoA oxidase
MHLALGTCKNLGLSGKGDPKTAQMNAKQVHVLSSGLKAAATWHRVRILQDCRECCGGMGFLAINKIGPMLNDMNVDVTFEGDNTVMMQQVSKALMDAFGKERPTVAVPVINQMDIGPGCAGKLLKWREQILTRQAAEEASAGSYEGVMDIAVGLGWAWVDAVSYATFRQEIRTAPAAWREPLERLCLLYGLCSVENHLATYLEHGVLQPRAVPVLRRKINDLCGYFAKDGAAVALGLCDGFGIPSHLLQAPIALGGGRGGWHDIGLS